MVSYRHEVFYVSLRGNDVHSFRSLLSLTFLVGVFSIDSSPDKLDQGTCIPNLQRALRANTGRFPILWVHFNIKMLLQQICQGNPAL